MSKSIFIYINTSDNKVTRIKIEGAGMIEELVLSGNIPQAQGALSGIEEIFVKHKLQLGDIKKIEFYPGPGSFTGLRVGSAVVNTLGWILGIHKPVYPKYD